MSLKQFRSNYRRFRADNHYSYPVLFYCVDILVSLLKILAVGMLLSGIWLGVSGLFAQKPEQPIASGTSLSDMPAEAENLVAIDVVTKADSESLSVQAAELKPHEPATPDSTEKPVSGLVLAGSLRTLEVMDQTWILKQDDGFTVQVGTSPDRSKLVDFAGEIDLNEQLHLYPFKVSRLGNPIYGLAFGVYPDFDTAEKVVAQLPASLRAYGPWIRPVGSLKNQVKTVLNSLE